MHRKAMETSLNHGIWGRCCAKWMRQLLNKLFARRGFETLILPCERSEIFVRAGSLRHSGGLIKSSISQGVTIRTIGCPAPQSLVFREGTKKSSALVKEGFRYGADGSCHSTLVLKCRRFQGRRQDPIPQERSLPCTVLGKQFC